MVVATDAVRRAIEQGDEATVPVVPIIEPLPYNDIDAKYIADPLKIGNVRIVTYR